MKHFFSRSIAAAACFAAIGAPSVAGATTIAGGTISNQTWTPAGNPYLLQGDITVPSGAFLDIEAGTIVDVASSDGQHAGVDTSRVEITIDGALHIKGTRTQPVRILASNGAQLGVWYGIIFSATAAAPTVTSVTIQNAVHGIETSPGSAALTMTNVTVGASSVGLYLAGGAATVDGAVLVGNDLAGVQVQRGGGLTLLNAVVARTQSGPGITVAAMGPTPVSVVNSTIDGNVVGLSCSGTPQVSVLNTIVSTNKTSFSGCSFTPVSCDVIGNTMGCNGTMCGPGNVEVAPLYVAAPVDYQLQKGSACIDAGVTGATVPDHDLNGAPRPLDGDGVGGAQVDLGAYEYVRCGNGVVDSGEACDDGVLTGMYGRCAADCSGPGPHCGDGIVNGPEECDDGNTKDGDGCSSTCKREGTAASSTTASAGGSVGGNGGGGVGGNGVGGGSAGIGGAQAGAGGAGQGGVGATGSSASAGGAGVGGAGPISVGHGTGTGASTAATTSETSATTGPSAGAGGGEGSGSGDSGGCGCRTAGDGQPGGVPALAWCIGACALIGARRHRASARTA